MTVSSLREFPCIRQATASFTLKLNNFGLLTRNLKFMLFGELSDEWC